jgi:hypothetical protein
MIDASVGMRGGENRPGPTAELRTTSNVILVGHNLSSWPGMVNLRHSPSLLQLGGIEPYWSEWGTGFESKYVVAIPDKEMLPTLKFS